MNIGRISDLISNETCFEMIRENRWSDGTVRCPHCDSENIKKNGHDNVQVECQHYYCKSCKRYFDDLTNTVFSGYQRPIMAWIACLYLMALNAFNSQKAQELGPVCQ
ncbi:transposase [Endozoicomonas sp.]|uniref:transposase n=1 Tax=Endozoicomonas sp. TaxID=1892382 RepID=UPI003AF83752